MDKIPPPAQYKPKYQFVDKNSYQTFITGKNIDQNEFKGKVDNERNTICTKILRTLKRDAEIRTSHPQQIQRTQPRQRILSAYPSYV